MLLPHFFPVWSVRVVKLQFAHVTIDNINSTRTFNHHVAITNSSSRTYADCYHSVRDIASGRIVSASCLYVAYPDLSVFTQPPHSCTRFT
jgi:hypothetical protein